MRPTSAEFRVSAPSSSGKPRNLRANSRPQKSRLQSAVWLAEERGFEPPVHVPKTVALPEAFAGLRLAEERECLWPDPRPGPARPDSVRYRAFGQWEAAQSRAASDKGTEVMPKLSDSQAVLLATAAARSDLSVLPPPETLTLKGAALERTLSALIRRGLIAEAAVERRARKSKWAVEEDDTRKRQRLIITPAGLDAIGVERGTEVPR